MTKSIIITGGGSGVGRATAEAFFEAGWKVGLIGRRREALEDDVCFVEVHVFVFVRIVQLNSCSCVGVGIGRAWASVGQASAKRGRLRNVTFLVKGRNASRGDCGVTVGGQCV